MDDNERAVYDLMYEKCFCCYTSSYALWQGAVQKYVRDNPPLSDEMPGYRVSPSVSCHYCLRVGPDVLKIIRKHGDNSER